MTHEHQSQEPRYASLRDYLRVLRDYKLPIAALAVIGCAAALFYSLQQESVYKATASIAFEDETREIGAFGLGPNPSEPAVQIASSNAATITRPQVMERVQQKLGTELAPGALASRITTQVDPSSALVGVIGTSSDPSFAAALANAVAKEAVALDNRRTRTRYAAAAETLQNESREQVKSDPSPNARYFYAAELSRLESLSKFARTAEVAEPAGVPGEPVSPKPVRSGILGLIGGLLLGLIFAFFRDSMDRRLHSADEIQSHFRLPVLGHVRDQSMGRIAYVDNGTNGDSKDDSTFDLEAFRILRRNLDFLEPGTSLGTIVVTSAFPEEGKTTVSSSLACVLAASGKLTLLVEADLRRPVLAERFGVEPTPGLADFLAGRATPQEVLRQVQFGEMSSTNGAGGNGAQPSGTGLTHNLVLIPAGSPTTNAAELLGSKRLREFLSQVAKIYDVVVIDSSPLLPVADTLELLPNVDGIVVCARELRTTREQARAVRTTLEHFPHRPTGLVVTGTRPNEGYEGYAYTYGYAQQA